MAKAKSFIEKGTRFGYWLVEEVGPLVDYNQTYICLCVRCGKTKQAVTGSNLKARKTTQCKNCYALDVGVRNYKHGKETVFSGKKIKALGLDLKFEEWAVKLGKTEKVLSDLLKRGLTIETISKM